MVIMPIQIPATDNYRKERVIMSIRRNWLYLAALVAMLILVSIGGAVNAAFPARTADTAGSAAAPVAQKVADDGFDKLPANLMDLSYSPVVQLGHVQPDM
jgi:hypothetical protein